MLVALAVAIVPALAVGAPRGKKKSRKPTPAAKKPVEPAPAEPTAPDPGTGEDEPATPPSPAAPTSAPAMPGGGGAGAGAGGGAGGGASASATPAAADAPDEPAAAEGADVDSLRQEYLALRDELFKSRARANTVASQLYSTRMQIKLTYTTARYYSPTKATIRLDGATVYEGGAGAIAEDDGVRFDGYVAPGRHLVTFRVEATGKDDETFTSVTETQIVVKAVAGKDLVVAAKARDGGDIAYEWKRKERGTYGLAIDTVIKTVPRADGAPSKGAAK